MANRLKYEKSPYLLQHGENPVDWYPWCKEAFQKAKTEEKPIFLSIGYSTCHWCHVMAHESFEDLEVAALLNKEYVCIKVDREERPDIDAVYMAVCQAMTGSGGWPLTILMTPEQKPFFAGTYFPKQGRFGQIGLLDILRQISKLWNEERSRLLQSSEQIAGAIREHTGAKPGSCTFSLLEQAYKQFRGQFDPQWGGFGTAPKFPSAHNLLFLLCYARLEQKPEAMDMVETTLQAMAAGGIFDQIGGGFSRYSTDEKWLIPHFEKMLYDNALLLIAYLTAYQLTENQEYADIAGRIASYICRELYHENGGFFSGQDADSDGVEGKYYLFTQEEVVTALGEKDAEAFCKAYGIEKRAPFANGSVPNRIAATGDAWKADDPRLHRLDTYRKARTHLHRDEKILLSWNGWAIIAMSMAGEILDEERYRNASHRTQRFIEDCMTDDNDRLYLCFCSGEAAQMGQLDDYAVYALSLLALYCTTFDCTYLELALHRTRQLVQLFTDGENGGYFMNAIDAEQLMIRPKESYDGAIPSGNSTVEMLLEELANLTGELEWREAADRQHAFMAGQAEAYPAGYGFGLLAMAKRLYPHKELLCVSNEVPSVLREYLKRNPAFTMSVLLKSKENAGLLASCAPFTQPYHTVESGVMWYLCENGAVKNRKRILSSCSFKEKRVSICSADYTRILFYQ